MGPKPPVLEGKEVDGDRSPINPDQFSGWRIFWDSSEGLAIPNFESDHSEAF